MAEPKTRPTGASVPAYLATIPDPSRRKDAKALSALMRRATGFKPEMWGTAIVGFGRKEWPGSGGKSAEWPLVAFSPRASAFTLYLMSGIKKSPELLAKLGPHKIGGGCLYIKRIADLDPRVLEQLVKRSLKLAQQG